MGHERVRTAPASGPRHAAPGLAGLPDRARVHPDRQRRDDRRPDRRAAGDPADLRDLARRARLLAPLRPSLSPGTEGVHRRGVSDLAGPRGGLPPHSLLQPLLALPLDQRGSRARECPDLRRVHAPGLDGWPPPRRLRARPVRRGTRPDRPLRGGPAHPPGHPPGDRGPRVSSSPPVDRPRWDGAMSAGLGAGFGYVLFRAAFNFWTAHWEERIEEALAIGLVGLGIVRFLEPLIGRLRHFLGVPEEHALTPVPERGRRVVRLAIFAILALASVSHALLHDMIKRNVAGTIGILVVALLIPGGITYAWLVGARKDPPRAARYGTSTALVLGALHLFLPLVLITLMLRATEGASPVSLEELARAAEGREPVLDGLGDEGMARHDAALAGALGAERVERRRRLEVAQLEDGRRVRRGGARVVHQGRGEALAAVVVRELDVQRVGQALHHRAVDLAVHDPRLEHVAAVVRHDPAQDGDRAGLRIHLQHHRVGAVGVARLLDTEDLGGLEPGGLPGHPARVRGRRDLAPAQRAARQPAHREPAALDHQVGGRPPQQGPGHPARLPQPPARGHPRRAPPDRG